MPLSRLNRFKRPSFESWPFEEKLYFPKGLHGFENHTQFSLIGHQHEKPYLRLVSCHSYPLTFIVVDPFPLHPGYEPVITHHDITDLSVIGEAKLILLTVVNTSESPHTMNLEAPLLIHWHKRLGKQLLFPSNKDFSIDCSNF